MARYDGTANLIQNQKGGLTSEKAREIGQKGAAASVISRRRRKAMREVMNNIMTCDVSDETLRGMLAAAGIEPTNENAIPFAMINRAARGDVEAARFVRDTLGEKPTENYNFSVGSKPVKSLDLSGYSDEELERLADGVDDENDGGTLPAHERPNG
jgi:hypothetical protein